MKTIPLHDGTPVPALGLGTWKSKAGQVENAVRAALDVGYRHIDCAAIYGNEAEVGQALQESSVPREELWITSKLWNDAHHPDDLPDALQKTLSDLRLERLDLYLMHWPIAHQKGVALPDRPEQFRSLDEVPLQKTWEAMLRCRDRGLVRYVGVSNFSESKLRLLSGSEPVAMNQVELHPYLQQTQLLEACAGLGCAVTAYSPLGSPDSAALFGRKDEQPLLTHPTITQIAEKKGATAGQVLIAWGLERGTAVIPKSTRPERIRENFESAQLELDTSDMEAIEKLESHHRLVDGAIFCGEGSPYTLDGLWS